MFLSQFFVCPPEGALLQIVVSPEFFFDHLWFGSASPLCFYTLAVTSAGADKKAKRQDVPMNSCSETIRTSSTNVVNLINVR